MERNNNSSYIQKKGDRDSRENYRGIASRNAGYKILANTILEKIKPYIEKITRHYQNGFIDGRFVIDNIFVLKVINEKIWEYNRCPIFIFIDFKRTYNSIQTHNETVQKNLKFLKN